MHERVTMLGLAGLSALALSPSGYSAEQRTQETVVLAAATEPRTKPLDLRAPDITKIFTAQQIDRVLRATRDPDTIEEVEVERERGKEIPSATPDIPPGILSPFWALMNPLQAWRILAPLPPDQAKRAGAPRDATDSYRPPVLPPQ